MTQTPERPWHRSRDTEPTPSIRPQLQQADVTVGEGAVFLLLAGGGTWLAQPNLLGIGFWWAVALIVAGRMRSNRHHDEEAARFWAEEQRLRAIRLSEIQSYFSMEAREFEHAVAFLCERDGCRDVQVVGGRGDLGADVKATLPDGRRLVVQCKRYAPTRKVGSQDVQKFGGTCYAEHQADVAVLVTTACGFTRDAAQYATRQGIGQYDADRLAGWASRTGPAPWH